MADTSLTAEKELVIESDKDCDSNVDYINEIKKRLDFIESILKIKVTKVKKTKP